jgi:hypothetical protein
VKRLGIAISLLLSVFVLVYALGRAPSEYALQTDAAAHQQARRNQYNHLKYEMRKALAAKADTSSLKAQSDAMLLQPVVTRLGGWNVVYLPPGTAHSGSKNWSVAPTIRPARADDPAPLSGSWGIRMHAAGAWARFASALGLAP